LEGRNNEQTKEIQKLKEGSKKDRNKEMMGEKDRIIEDLNRKIATV
jgi:hypothetical protein